MRVSMAGAYALDWSVVVRVADSLGIETDERFFKLLKAFEGVMIKNFQQEK